MSIVERLRTELARGYNQLQKGIDAPAHEFGRRPLLTGGIVKVAETAGKIGLLAATVNILAGCDESVRWTPLSIQ